MIGGHRHRANSCPALGQCMHSPLHRLGLRRSTILIKQLLRACVTLWIPTRLPAGAANTMWLETQSFCGWPSCLNIEVVLSKAWSIPWNIFNMLKGIERADACSAWPIGHDSTFIEACIHSSLHEHHQKNKNVNRSKSRVIFCSCCIYPWPRWFKCEFGLSSHSRVKYGFQPSWWQNLPVSWYKWKAREPIYQIPVNTIWSHFLLLGTSYA